MFKQLDENHIVFGPVRLSYLNVFKTKKNAEGKEQFSVQLWIPKKATDQCPNPNEMLKGINDLVNAMGKPLFPKGFRKPLRDGDATDDGDPKAPGYWFMNVNSSPDYPPTLIDGAKNVCKDPTAWVSGDWGIVKASIYTYDQPQNKGVSLGLNALQFVYKDEPLGRGPDSDDFDVIPDAVGTTSSDDYNPFEDS